MQRNAEYHRRRRIAEDTIAREGLMPDEPFVTGLVRLELYEQLVREHMPPPGEAYAYEAPAPPPELTHEEVVAALSRPAQPRDPLTRAQSMAAAIGEQMAEAERVSRGEAAGEAT